MAAQQRSAGRGQRIDRRAQLEREALESTYTKLLADQERSRMQVNIERRQIGGNSR